MKHNYHISFSSNTKSANPLARLLAGIIALLAIPVALIVFTGVLAFFLAAVVTIAAVVIFLKILAPGRAEREVIEEVEYTVSGEPASRQRKSGYVPGTRRRKPVVIEHDNDALN